MTYKHDHHFPRANLSCYQKRVYYAGTKLNSALPPCCIFGLHNVKYLHDDQKHLYKTCTSYSYCIILILWHVLQPCRVKDLQNVLCSRLTLLSQPAWEFYELPMYVKGARGSTLLLLIPFNSIQAQHSAPPTQKVCSIYFTHQSVFTSCHLIGQVKRLMLPCLTTRKKQIWRQVKKTRCLILPSSQ